MCGLPGPGIEPMSPALAWQADSSPLSLQGSTPPPPAPDVHFEMLPLVAV